jgi:protein-S-isoprenylcysteine O-methyltransferase Ste14
MLLLILSWILYGVLHSWLASHPVKQLVKRQFPVLGKYYRLLYTIFAFLGLAAVIIFQLYLPAVVVFVPSTVSLVAGILSAVTGMCIMFICIHKYFFQLSGLKSLYASAPSNELMITGIHRYIRHPLYSGTFLFIWGAWLLWPYDTFLAANIVITVYTLIGIRLEEQKLVKEFGESYKAYKKRVPMLVPRLF